MGIPSIICCCCSCSWKDYFIYDRSLLFVIGLVFSRSLTYHVIIYIMMWYLTYSDQIGDFTTYAVLSNIQDSLSSLFVIFMANSADSFVGRFRTLVFSTTAYICGVLILWTFDPYDETWFVVAALVLLALGKSGDNILKYVLTDLVDGIDVSAYRNKKRSLSRGTVWWRIPHVFGAIVGVSGVAPLPIVGIHETWKTSFLICMVSMTATLIIFCTGHNFYHQGELTQRPVELVFRVFHAKLQKLLKSNSRCWMNTSAQERSPETRRQENEGITQDHQNTSAQERSPTDSDTIGKNYRGNTFNYQDDIKVVRNLLRMFPMWGTLIVVSLISAAGRTVYIVQFNNLRPSEKIFSAALVFYIIQDLSGFAILILYKCTRFCQNEKLKIGVGMLCSIISCVCAWRFEIYRLKSQKQLGDNKKTAWMSLWLVPQFCILGCMEWLTKDGSLKFFKSQIEEPIKSYGEEYMEVVMCLGKLVSIFLILILKSQPGFGYEVRTKATRLHNYFLLLVCLCSVNFVIYCCIAKYLYKRTQPDAQSTQDNVGTR